MILAGNVSVPRDFDLWPSDPKINGFPELVVDQVSLSLKLVILAIGFWDIVWKTEEKQTDI